MRIVDIESAEISGGHRLSAAVYADGISDPMQVWFRITGVDSAPPISGDAFVVGLLVPCMFEGENLHVDAPVSARLLAGLDRAQEILAAWLGFLKPVKVTAREVCVNPTLREGPSRVGCFFSGGASDLRVRYQKRQ